MGEVVESASVRIGGDIFDEAISRYIKRKYNVLIGERTAEMLKIAIGSAHLESRHLESEVRGRDLITGLPRSVAVTTDEVVEALRDSLLGILQGVKQVLERTPELAGDIIEKGIVLTGGGALLDGLPYFYRRKPGFPSF